MTSWFAMRGLLFAGELFLASGLVMALAGLAAMCFSRRASLRHLIWVAAFGILLLLPAAALLLPSRIVLEEQRAEVSIAQAPRLRAVPVAPAVLPVAPSDIAGPLLLLWLAGLLIMAAHRALTLLNLRRLLRRSAPYDDGLLPPPSRTELAAAGCHLRLGSGDDLGPATWGLWKPVILLPQNAVNWPAERLQAVLRHELAHVGRRDSLVQFASLLVSAFYWPNPLVWLGARALRREAELAADDRVLVSGIAPSAYAGELVRLAAEFRARRGSFSGVAMVGSALEQRVESVLALTPIRTGVTVMDTMRLACLAAAATAALALLRPDIAVAQNPVPAQAAAPSDQVTAVPPEPPADARRERAKPASRAQRQVQSNVQIHAQARVTQRQVEKAVAEARIGETVARAMAQAQPQIDAAVAEAMKQAQPRIDKAVADVGPHGIPSAIAQARIGEAVAKAMAQAQPQIDATIAQARADASNAIAQARIGEAVAKAMAQAQPQIDAAIAQAKVYASKMQDAPE